MKTTDQHPSCSACGSEKVVKSGFDTHGSQRFLCKECGAVAPLASKIRRHHVWNFKGRDGKVYTTKMILAEIARHGCVISHQTALNRIKAAIKDPRKEDSLFDPPNNKANKLHKTASERLTAEQRETMNDFKAVHDKKMTLHELLEK